MSSSGWFPLTILLLLGLQALGAPLPKEGWKAERREVTGLDGEHQVVLIAPQKNAAPAVYTSARPFAPGIYRVSLSLRLSHVHEEIAWATELEVVARSGNLTAPVRWPALHFARRHQPENRSFEIVLSQREPLSFELRGVAESGVIAQARANQQVAEGGVQVPTLGGTADDPLADDALGGLDLSFEIGPASHVYACLGEASAERLTSAWISSLTLDKVRYAPGETVRAVVEMKPAAGRAEGHLRIGFASHTAADVPAIVRELTLTGPQRLELEVPLPEGELGHALTAHWVDADGEPGHRRQQVFNITDHPWRAAIAYVRPIHNETNADAYDRLATRLADNYYNLREVFFWAEEDMVEMSPETDYWFSGQTTYHVRKAGLQAMIRDLRARGIAVSTYGKYQMSGYLGWRTAWDYPFDHKAQYAFPLGMWEGTDVPALDRFKGKEFAAQVPTKGGLLGHGLGGLPFLPINPDPTPRNVHTAAMETIRSIEMFGWDAIRWDGHMRGLGNYGNSCGGARPEKYDYDGHRQTQLLVRYFKDLVNAEYPDFAHGYNYLFATDTVNYDWAIEDFELDELARGGGLLMNESIGNHGFGKPFSWFIANLQEEGDLCRERDSYYLAIARTEHPRDKLVQTALWYAAGARPYGSTTENRLLNRYATRFSSYVFDEHLVRLDKAKDFLRPTAETRLLYDAFVYACPPRENRQELVVNLLNLDPKHRTLPKGENERDMSLWPGTEPVPMQLDLPERSTIAQATLIDPWSLAVTPVEHTDDTVQVPAVSLWSVLVLELDHAAGSTVDLATRYGPPATLGKQREKLPVERRAFDPLDMTRDVVEVNKNMAGLFAEEAAGHRPFWQEREGLAALSMAERNTRLLAERQPVEPYLKGYPYGVKLPDDLKLKESPPELGPMAPLRNGQLDIFLARGAMDYRLRLYEAFGQLPGVQVREGRYVAPFSGKHHGMELRPSPALIAEHDLLIIVDVPHAGIGVRQAYALVPWVKAGGAALFFGGEYAFGKGRYAHTVLERELLPVVAIEARDNRYVREPLRLEPGPDLPELEVSLDFSAEPCFWAWNQVALRPDAEVKVFLQAGNRPILVGWELGEGRVAAWLAMHRGHSSDTQTAFFDWEQWPGLMAAVVQWLTPGAAATDDDPRQLTAAREDDVVTALAGGALDSLLAGGGDDLLGQSGAPRLPEAPLAERVRQIHELLRGGTSEGRQLLAEQLIQVANLPLDTRLRIMVALAHGPAPALPAGIDAALEDPETAVRSGAQFLLALRGDPRFQQLLRAGPPSMEASPLHRQRLLAMAIATWPDEALLAEGTRRLQAWNREEAASKQTYTDGQGFSMAAPEVPLLDSESYYQRVGWLAYLGSQQPERFAGQLTRQWALLPQYADWCQRTIANIDWGLAQGAPSPAQRQAAAQQKRELREFMRFLYHAAEQLEPTVARAAQAAPAVVGEALRACNFRLEAVPVINLIGQLPDEAATELRAAMGEPRQYLLREYLQGRGAAGD